jgi:hypothetical protein
VAIAETTRTVKERLTTSHGFLPLNDGNLYHHADRTTIKFSHTTGNTINIQITRRGIPQRATWTATNPTADAYYQQIRQMLNN